MLATLLLNLLPLLPAGDTVSLAGCVVDASGRPLPGASVVVRDTDRGVVTDGRGEFRLGSADGRPVRISFTGYRTVDTTWRCADADRPLRVVMQRDGLGLDEVVVTGSRIPRALKDAPVVTRVITAREIEQTSPQSLSDVLESELPGIEFTRTEGVKNGITFQGLGANYLLILVDGERMAGETSRSNPDFNRIDMDNVERIEIVRGAMSTLYGSGAVAGVINIITKTASKPFQARLSGRYHGEGEQKYGLNIGSGRGRLTSYTSALARLKSAYTARSREPLRQYYEDGSVVEPSGALPEVEIEGYRNFTVEQKIGYRVSKRIDASVKGSFYNHERYNAGMEGELKHDVYRDWNALLRAAYALSPRSRFELSYNFDDYSKYDKYLRLGESERNYVNRIHNPKLLFSTDAIRSNTLVAGAEWLGESLRTYQFDDTARRVGSFAAYVQDDYRVTPWLTLQAGLRLDCHSEYGARLNPKLSAMAKAGHVTLRAGYAAGFRAPSLKELYTQWDHQGMFELVGNRDLKPERSHNLSLSAEYTAGAVNLSVGGYYNKLYDKISMIWNATQDTSYYSNVADGAVSGLDVNVRVSVLRHFALRGGYSYVRDRQLVDGHNTSSTRPHSATLRLEYGGRVGRSTLTAGLGGRWMGGLDVYSRDETRQMWYRVRYPGYSIWKLSCTGELPRGIRLTAGVDNLFNYRPGVVTYNAGITRGTTFFAGITLLIEELFGK